MMVIIVFLFKEFLVFIMMQDKYYYGEVEDIMIYLVMFQFCLGGQESCLEDRICKLRFDG